MLGELRDREIRCVDEAMSANQTASARLTADGDDVLQYLVVNDEDIVAKVRTQFEKERAKILELIGTEIDRRKTAAKSDKRRLTQIMVEQTKQATNKHADNLLLIVYCQDCGYVINSVHSPNVDRNQMQEQTTLINRQIESSISALSTSMCQCTANLILEMQRGYRQITDAIQGMRKDANKGGLLRQVNDIDEFLENRGLGTDNSGN